MPKWDGAAVRVTVDFLWKDIGRVRIEGGKLRFPDTPEEPGVYRFDFGDRVYVGEADRLRRRFQHYRTPGPSQATNLRLNAAMLPLLASGMTIAVCTITQATVEIDNLVSPLDLSKKATRLLVESAALTAAQLAGAPVENL